MAALRLRLRRYGDDGAHGSGTPLLLLHGLFGSAANWHGIARRLGEERPVLVPDLRNHGDSPHAPRMDYPAMAEDLAATLDAENAGRIVVVGHSMGGKLAMWLALCCPERLAGLAVVDIAPRRYPDGFDPLIDALIALPLGAIRDRRDADRRLAQQIPSAAVRGYLLQNLRRAPDGWQWRIDLAAIAAAMPALLDFPDPDGSQFTGPTLFIYGTASPYIDAAALPAIRARFPLARLRAIPNAGHWVYADSPDAFTAALQAFTARL